MHHQHSAALGACQHIVHQAVHIGGDVVIRGAGAGDNPGVPGVIHGFHALAAQGQGGRTEVGRQGRHPADADVTDDRFHGLVGGDQVGAQVGHLLGIQRIVAVGVLHGVGEGYVPMGV